MIGIRVFSGTGFRPVTGIYTFGVPTNVIPNEVRNPSAVRIPIFTAYSSANPDAGKPPAGVHTNDWYAFIVEIPHFVRNDIGGCSQMYKVQTQAGGLCQGRRTR